MLGPKSGTTYKALKAAYALGIHVVVAAGNKKEDSCSYSPADFRPGLTVAASTKQDKFATGYSNWGPCVDIIAPGSAIVSAAPGARSVKKR